MILNIDNTTEVIPLTVLAWKYCTHFWALILFFFLSEKRDTYFDSKADSLECPHCTSVFSAHKNLKKHIRDVHTKENIPMICVDIVNGLYVTPKHDHSPVVPIHVVKSTNPPKID